MGILFLVPSAATGNERGSGGPNRGGIMAMNRFIKQTAVLCVSINLYVSVLSLSGSTCV